MKINKLTILALVYLFAVFLLCKAQQAQSSKVAAPGPAPKPTITKIEPRDTPIVTDLIKPTSKSTPTKEDRKTGKEEAKAKERVEKQAEKERAKQEKQQRAARLASVPTLSISGVRAETFGQILTLQMANEGFSLTEYQAPQQVFGMSTAYKAVYSKAVTDLNTLVDTRVWIWLNYGVPTDGQGAITYFMAFEIGEMRGEYW